VFDAEALDKSATLPRISPDGRFLMFTLGDYGVFHIWHGMADLWMADLEANLTSSESAPQSSPEGDTIVPDSTEAPSGTVRGASPLTALNSPSVESYHSWSSNGRWVIFSSRRNDGNYTRPFIAHIDKDGRATKPFELPCSDPDYHRQFMKCYNVLEFMKGPVTMKPREFADVLKGDAVPVKYVPKLNP
jgi:Tol biopolymer transport system component